MNRAERRLVVRALHLEPHVAATDELLGGLADALCDLARFLGAAEVTIDRSEPAPVAPALAERLAPLSKAHDLGGCVTGLCRCAPSTHEV
jgi:uncharacterized protein YcaQ